MKHYRFKFVCVTFLLFVSIAAYSAIRLPAVISSNMVLQRQSSVALWGEAANGERVKILTSWNGKQYITKANEAGHWKQMVQTPAAGGPYTISFEDGRGRKTVLTNILIGEVWVCSGQSNMEIPMKGYRNQPIQDADKILMNADNPQIRLFNVQKTTASHPLADCSGQWEPSDAQSAGDFSAVAYIYGKILQEKLKVPVGLIESSWGGTPISAWMDGQSLQAFPMYKIPDPADTGKLRPGIPSSLFNGMIAPIVNYAIGGFIWYQGENDHQQAALYEKLMPAMVAEWRKLWKEGSLPFYYVQIAPYGYKDGQSPFLREAQLHDMDSIPNSGMAVTMDIGDEHTIHPFNKATVSLRLAYWALANAYHEKGLVCSGPVYRSMKINGSKIDLVFDDAGNGLSFYGKTSTCFEIAGADHKFYPAKARITNNGLEVESDSVQAPVAVRYAFKDWVVGDLYNTYGLPASSFRTDNWSE